MKPIFVFLTLLVFNSSAWASDLFPPKHKLFCEFYYGNQLLTLPDAYMIFDPIAKTVITRAGNPLVTTVYKNVQIRMGLPPYYNHGYTVTVFGDAPLLSVSEQQFDTIPILAYLLQNHEATWGVAPGFVSKFNNGLCYENPFFKDNFKGW